MHCTVWAKRAGVVVVVALLWTSAGCKDPAKSRSVVKGQVTFNGKAVPGATVAFFGGAAQVESGITDLNGNYSVGAPTGDCKVTVSVPKMAGMSMGAKKDMGKSPTKMQDPNDPGKSMGAPAIDPSKFVAIPDKYAEAGTSGLTFKVEKGENKFDIPLKP